MKPKFKPGDVVQLQSGSFSMTVEDIHDGQVDCVWFDQASQLRRGSFSALALKLV